MSLAVLAACVLAVPPTTQEKKPMQPRMMSTVELQGGKNWNPALPPEKQDLAAHFVKAKADFEKGELVMNGPLTETMHGFYLYDDADAARTQARVDADDGIKKQVLAAVEVRPWAVVVDHSSASVEGKTLYVLEYGPGAAYARGQPLERQDGALVQAHLDYVMNKGSSVYLGGPVDPAAGRGRYVIAAMNREAVLDFIKQDPGVKGLLFSVTQVLTWRPFQRQAVRARG